jgi:hypothetical protein
VEKHARAKQSARPWTRNELLALVPAFGASAWGLYAGLDFTGWWLILTSIVAAVIVVRAWKLAAVVTLCAALLWLFAGQPQLPASNDPFTQSN